MTTKRPTKASELFPSAWFKHSDLEGGELTAVIRQFEFEPVGPDREMKGVLYFHNVSKGLILNKTNTETIQDLYGDDLNSWVGKAITLFHTVVPFGSRMVDAVRVRPNVPNMAPVGVVEQAEALSNMQPPPPPEFPF